MITITADLDYISGHLRYGHISMELTEEQLEEFELLSEEAQKEWLEDEGEIIVDDFTVNDRGDLGKIKIHK